LTNTLNFDIEKDNPGWAATMSSGTGPLNDTIIFSRRDLRTVEDILSFKYSFTNKMGITLRQGITGVKWRHNNFNQLAQDGKWAHLLFPLHRT